MVYPEVSYFRQYDRTKRIESGCELGISGSYSLNDNDDNDFSACVPLSNGYESWYRKQDLDYSLNLQARYERPLSRYYQLSLNAQGRGGISREWNSSLDTYRDTYAADPGVREYRYALPMISAGESVSLAYYPNTRTSMKITENAEYWREFDYFDISGTRYGANELPLIDGPNYDQRGLMVSLNGDASYYFSPQVQAGLSLRLAWSDSYRYFYGRTPWPGGFYYYSSSYATHVSTSSRGFDYSIGMNLTWKLL